MMKSADCEPVFWRVENKYRLSKVEFEKLLSIFKNVLPIDRNKTYCVSSLYFDDDEDSCLEDTINGQPIREKFRIRIYNNSLDSIKLEHKIKKYSYIHKDSAPLTKHELTQLIQGKPVLSDNNLVCLINHLMLTKNLRPKIIITYERTAFIYSKGNVRITFDENLQVSDDFLKFGNRNILYRLPPEPFRIVEVKYDEFLPDFIANLLECGNMWQSANSKYRISREFHQSFL